MIGVCCICWPHVGSNFLKMKIVRILLIIIIVSFIGIIFYLAVIPNPPSWTGFGESVKSDKLNEAKSLWDWLDLLIIPAAIALIGWLFSEIEKSKNNKREEERSQNEIVESFLQTMTNLIIEHGLHDNLNQQLLSIVRARINIAVNNLNGARRGQILQFLYESELIDFNPKIKLLGINFQNALLDEIVLGQSEIKGAYFNNASIKNANLKGGNFTGCDFSRANFSNSLLENTDFSYSILSKASLKYIDLTTVNFEGAILNGANLKGSTILKTQLENIHDKKKIKVSKTKVI
jgi:uncharacterized protein YjbI with pentapeptide repeats